MKLKPFFRKFCRVLLPGVGTLLLFIILFYRIDTLTLWGILPGIDSSKEIREFGNGLISVIEELPEDENAQTMVSSMAILGAVASAAQTAQEGGIDDQIVSQYTLGLVKAGLLEKQGTMSAIEYQFYKFPFKTGNTKIMQLALPALQKKAILPEGFMSEEDINAQLEAKSPQKTKPEVDEELLEYKEKHIYGRYHQMALSSSYLDVSGSPDKTHDIIRFVTNSNGESSILEQEFTYRMNQTHYTTDDGITEFHWAESILIAIAKGGMESPSSYIKSNDIELLFPDSDVRKLTEAEVALLDDEERQLTKNEIYARYDYPFEDPKLREYFEHFGWYGPAEYPPEEFDESVFTETELHNLELLK